MPYKKHVHTITINNGREFAHHEKIAKALDVEIDFAHSYFSWKLGANKNANGLLRQYVKKGINLGILSDEKITFSQARINHRPKKCLKFKWHFRPSLRKEY